MDAASVHLIDAGPVAVCPADAVEVSAGGIADVALGVLVKSGALFVVVVFVFIDATLGHFGLSERRNNAVIELSVGVARVLTPVAGGQAGMSGQCQEGGVRHKGSQDLFVPGEDP